MAKRFFLWMLMLSVCLLWGCDDGGGSSSQLTQTELAARRLDELFAKDANFHGTVLVAKEGGILLCKGYGMADNARGTICTPSTVYPIGSMTKQFTSLAVMQLYERGKLDIADPLSKYLPDFPKGDAITIKNLLTHTSGLRDYINDDWKEFDPLPLSELTEKNIIDKMAGKTLRSEPGQLFHYSNTNYLILGYLLEQVSGMSYLDYLNQNIFTPLKMESTWDIIENGELHFAVLGYEPKGNYKPTVDGDGLFLWSSKKYSNAKLLTAIYGAGCLQSTVGDLYLWDRALYTDTLLSKQYRDMLFEPYANTGTGSAYALGWVIVDDPEYGRIACHNGQLQGFSSWIYRYLTRDITIIVLTNSDGYTLNRQAFQTALEGGDPSPAGG